MGEDPGTWPQTSETAAFQGLAGEQGLPLLSLLVEIWIVPVDDSQVIVELVTGNKLAVSS